MRNVRKPYLIAFITALILYVMGVTYQLATIEKRLGEVEHTLVCETKH